jgi:hypothetical protein
MFARSIASGVTTMAIAAACAPAYTGEEWPDGPNKDFFQNLLRPDNHKRPHQDPSARSCCGAAVSFRASHSRNRLACGHPLGELWLPSAEVRIWRCGITLRFQKEKIRLRLKHI